MCMKLSDIPEEIIKENKLLDIVDKAGYFHLAAIHGMYDLLKSGLLANKLLKQQLNQHGYHQSKLVAGFWTHKWQPIDFTLMVDNIGIKYIEKEHALHLKSISKEHYTVNWDCNQQRVHLSMPGYVCWALKQFQHHKPCSPQHQPFPCDPICYGAKLHFAMQPSTAPSLNKQDKKFIQKMCGKFLFYVRAVDPTILCPISAIASQSVTPTMDTMAQIKELFD
ncbi:hypothetical protein ACHAW6_006889 [Cyclotella cf. meneghiniana]